MVLNIFNSGRPSEVAWIVVFHVVVAMYLDLISGQRILLCTKNGVQWGYVPMKADELCCNGVVEAEDPYKDKDCCDDVGKFYYKAESLCCEGEIQPNRDGELGCCNNQTFNTSSHSCCGRRLYPRDGDMTGMSCCGENVYNRSEEICCQDPDEALKTTLSIRRINLTCCGHIPMDERYRECSFVTGKPQVIYRQQQICNVTTIDITQQTCCLDTVYNVPLLDPHDPTTRNPKSECCGRINFNSNTHICCPHYNFVLPKDGPDECCGNGSADRRHQVCCGDQAVTLTIPGGQCCGQHLIDPDTQSCCLWEPYTKLTQKCCRSESGLDQQVIDVGGGECCGGKELKAGEICCMGVQPVHKTHPADDSCCEDLQTGRSSVYSTYNSREKACFDGRLVTRLGPTDEDCYGARYRPEEAVCCGDKVHYFPPGQTLKCCQSWSFSYNVYNIDTQMCCRGVVSNASITEYECCGTEAIHKDKGDNPCKRCDLSTLIDPHLLCCGGRKILKSFGNKCCGKRAYFSSRSTCCEDKLYDVPKKGKECCGRVLYDPAHELCSPHQQLLPLSSSATSVFKFTAYLPMVLSFVIWKIS